jgi:hypothetical protein
MLKMAELLGNTPRWSVTVHDNYDTVQASGQKIEWNEVRTLTVSRPDRLRMEAEKSNGARTMVIFDGKAVSIYDEAARVYAQAPQPGGLDQTVVYFVRDLGLRLPLAALLLSRAATGLDRRVQSVQYVEKTGILGTPEAHPQDSFIAGETRLSEGRQVRDGRGTREAGDGQCPQLAGPDERQRRSDGRELHIQPASD